MLNKPSIISFIITSVIYVSGIYVFMAFIKEDILVGEKMHEKYFSIGLEHISPAREINSNATKKEPPKKSKPNKTPKKMLESPIKDSDTTLANNVESKTLKQDSSVESSIDSNKISMESNIDSNMASTSSLQSPKGENNEYFMMIKKIINKYHSNQRDIPSLRGSVRVKFSININGDLEYLDIIKTSGSVRLDNLSLKTIKRASKSFPKPSKYEMIMLTLDYK